jgi:hypothetical protein
MNLTEIAHRVRNQFGDSAGAVISDESGGQTIASSDGVNWRRAADRAICT